MPLIFGPFNSRFAFTGSRCPHSDLAYQISDLTLGDALRSYEAKFDTVVMPSSLPLPGSTELKCFLVGNGERWGGAVEVVVRRGSTDFRPGHDTTFALEQSDIVELQELYA